MDDPNEAKGDRSPTILPSHSHKDQGATGASREEDGSYRPLDRPARSGF